VCCDCLLLDFLFVGGKKCVPYRDTFFCETSSALNDEPGRKAGHGFPLSDTLCVAYRFAKMKYKIRGENGPNAC
jgi:hypothetical protein